MGMSMERGSRRILPGYSWIPLLSVVCINFLAYYATRLITRGTGHFDFSLHIDSAIPFIPSFSVIYLLAYVQWVVGFILIARESRDFCYRTLSGEIISKLICMTLFIVIPTTMVRADIVRDGFFSDIVRFIYRMDTPDNLFPSLHCLESWLCFRASAKMKKTGKWYMYSSLIFSLLVFASTVFIKQHVTVDIIAGVIVCEIGQLIAKKTNSACIFMRVENTLNRKPDAEASNEKNG